MYPIAQIVRQVSLKASDRWLVDMSISDELTVLHSGFSTWPNMFETGAKRKQCV
jgi:hypothetical protein